MSKYRPYETKRGRLKITKNLASIYRQTKCRKCAVIVTPMDFAKILGKFTKVKIQYENSSSPSKSKQKTISPVTNARLKSNENGMVLIHRNAYQQHPVKELTSNKRQKQQPKLNETSIRSKVGTPISKVSNKGTPAKVIAKVKDITPSKIKGNATSTKVNNKITPAKVNNKVTPVRDNKTRQKPPTNILKENNRVKDTPLKDKNSNYDERKPKTRNGTKLRYKVTFDYPKSSDDKITNNNEVSLSELLPQIDKSILPSEVWVIDYFPKNEEPKDDKVYDRIAAELEDLMYNDKVAIKPSEGKVEEFPSIMEILNDTDAKNKISDTNDVEAMLLGDGETKTEPIAMEVDQESSKPDTKAKTDREGSPSILENPGENEPNKKGVIETESNKSPVKENEDKQEKILPEPAEDEKEDINKYLVIKKNESTDSNKNSNSENATHVIFKRIENGICSRLVTCPKSLIYNIELEGKSVKLRGAPQFISSLEDLRVLLEIVDETEIGSFYVLQ